MNSDQLGNLFAALLFVLILETPQNNTFSDIDVKNKQQGQSQLNAKSETVTLKDKQIQYKDKHYAFSDIEGLVNKLKSKGVFQVILKIDKIATADNLITLQTQLTHAEMSVSVTRN
jgi:hypothetical protein